MTGSGLDFALDDQQRELTALSSRLFGDLATPARVAEIEQTDDRFDRRLWQALAQTSLLGLGIEPEWGGSGAGLVEVALLLEQCGRAVAPVPLVATMLLGGYPVRRYGGDEWRARWLPGVAAGAHVLTGAYDGVDPKRGSAPVTASDTPDCASRLPTSACCFTGMHEIFEPWPKATRPCQPMRSVISHTCG